MIKHRFAVVLGSAIALASGAAGVHAAPAKSAKNSESAKAVGHVVEYTELEHQVGAVLVIETNLNTARRGVLIKYTNPVLTLQLGPEAGSIDLSVPRDSIRRITVVEPATSSTQEAGSAKKN
jgi:hypothetical protein